MLKPGVDISGLGVEVCFAYIIACNVFMKLGYDCIITSGRDGSHSKKSKHYVGHAIDLRTQHVKTLGEKEEIVRNLKDALPGFDVLFEYVGTTNEHIHCEFDPKRI